MSLRDRLMLASCEIHLWGNERKDSLVDAEVAQAKQVKKGKAGKWRTNLLAGADAEYESLKKAQGLCRAYHYSVTLPWARGEQVLPSQMFLDYARTMTQYRALAEQRLDDLIQVWDTRVQEAMQNSPILCANFKYPTASQLKTLCGVVIEINPLPEGMDLILDIENEEAQKLLGEERTRIESIAEQRAAEAMKELWDRFQKILVNAQRNLSLEVGSETGRYREEWYENLLTFAQVAKKMNFQNDPKLDELVLEAQELLKTDAEEYKKEDDTRQQGEEKVKDILRKMQGIF